MEVRHPRHPVAFAALIAGVFVVQTAAQESRPLEPFDLLARERDVLLGADAEGPVLLGVDAEGPPPPVVFCDVRVHVLDAQGRPWRPGESRGAVVRYGDSRLPFRPFGYEFGLQVVAECDTPSPVDAEGRCMLRVASRRDGDALFWDGDFGGVLRIDEPNENALLATALCVHPLRRLRLRGRTALGVPIAFSRVRSAETDAGPAIFARPDRPFARSDCPDVTGEVWVVNDSELADRLWSHGVVCPKAPLTVRAEILGRALEFDVPATCEVYEAPIDGLGAASFLTASHNRWTLIQPGIEPRRSTRANPDGPWPTWHPTVHWLDDGPIKDGYVGRRRALMWPGSYRVTPYGGQPVEFEVRADETVEVPLP